MRKPDFDACKQSRQPDHPISIVSNWIGNSISQEKYELAHEIWVLTTDSESRTLNMHTQLSSQARGLIMDLEPSSASISCVCMQRRLWQDCIETQAFLGLGCLLM